MKKIEKKYLKTLILWCFMMLFLFSIKVGLTLFAVNERKASHILQAKRYVGYQSSMIKSFIDYLNKDLVFIANSDNRIEYTKTKTDKSIARLERELSKYLTSRQGYFQARIIDKKGQEQVKIILNKQGSVEVISQSLLQNKKERDYFKKIISLNKGEIYITHIDLNKENGELEQPYLPTIRIGTPIFKEDEKVGIFILNFKGEDLLYFINESKGTFKGDIAILNESGFWVFNKNKSLEWGQYLGVSNNIEESNPLLWEKIKKDKLFFYEDLNSFYVWDKIDFNNLSLENPKNPDIIILYSINFEKHNLGVKELFYIPPIMAFVIGIFLAFISYIAILTLEEKDDYKKRIEKMALYDGLTNLPNRTLLMDRLNQLMEGYLRYTKDFALMFIDLDGFKNVNDQFGHDVGDKVLIEVSNRLEGLVRQIDTVARMGGDEFVILLTPRISQENCLEIASKILKSIQKPIIINNKNIFIGASIGIAIQNKHHRADIDLLIKRADNAMYRVKEEGKNSYRFA